MEGAHAAGGGGGSPRSPGAKAGTVAVRAGRERKGEKENEVARPSAILLRVDERTFSRATHNRDVARMAVPGLARLFRVFGQQGRH